MAVSFPDDWGWTDAELDAWIDATYFAEPRKWYEPPDWWTSLSLIGLVADVMLMLADWLP